jgi:hypothetical protein
MYSIEVKSSGQNIVQLKGVIGEMATTDGRLAKEFIEEYAARVDDTLKRDLAEASKK